MIVYYLGFVFIYFKQKKKVLSLLSILFNVILLVSLQYGQSRWKTTYFGRLWHIHGPTQF